MASKFLNIDFEYCGPSERFLNLVCCSYETTDKKYSDDIWLFNDDSAKFELMEILEYISEQGYIARAHNVVAEGRAYLSLGIKPYEIKWVDTFAEWRMITNHNHKLQFGKHLVKGKVKDLKAPRSKWKRVEGESQSGKLVHSLSEAVFKLLGIEIDTDHKNLMRDIIISGDDEVIEQNKEAIMKYCRSDIKYLDPMFKAMVKQYTLLGVDKTTLLDEMLWRGETMARTAVMEAEGYPIDYTATKNFSNSVNDILTSIQRDINEQFPEMGVFVRNPVSLKFVRKEKPIREWIEESGLGESWMKTATDQYSLSLEAFTKQFNFQHSYPRNNFGAQMIRLLKTKQNLNGFLPPKKGGKNFWDSVGSDHRSRAYLNPYGAQSARFQPGATGFLFLKSAWMRSLCVPPKGKMIVGIDYKSEEFLISACVSEDKKMVEAYKTGDVYLAFGKDAGLVPQDATKHSHPNERHICKSTVLGISYLMSKFGLAKALNVDEEEAQEYIDAFEDTYEDFTECREAILEVYQDEGRIKLPDGWIMFGDNYNHRSVGNVPIQGFGSCILRKAIQLCQDAGLKVIIPLHDALYIECDERDWHSVHKFAQYMREAFIHYFEGEQREYASNIMLDIEAWGPGLENMELENDGLKINCEKIHIDERSIDEYKNFSQYFTKPDYEEL